MLTTDYYTIYNKGLDSLAEQTAKADMNEYWGITKDLSNLRLRSCKLFLYLNALSRYDPASDTNYLDDAEVGFIISQVTKLSC